MSSTAVKMQPRAGAKTAGKDFEPGTFGWVASDLDNPQIEREWFKGRYEIVEGVLAKMPPAYFTGGSALYELMTRVDQYLEQRGKWRFATEVEVIVDEIRVPRADAVLLSGEDARKQRAAAKAAGRRDPRRTLILVPPTLIIESVSPGHELHDRRTKRRWYAEFGVPNYWILDAFEQSLECLRLGRGSRYVRDTKGKGGQKIKPSCFPDLVVNLANLWDEGDDSDED